MNYQPVVISTQSNGNAGIQDNNNAGQARKKKEPDKDYILLPLWTVDPPFPQDPKSYQDARFKPSNDVGKKITKVPRQENKCNDQEEKDGVNSINIVNAVSSTVNAASNEVNVVGFEDLDFPDKVYKVEKALYGLHQAPRAWCRLISWQCKKQTMVANSTTEAEYVVASSCCGQVLWI
nr:putative ribonuclease H-like domain-containing protein [Tanacetum cinerariifolium]